MNKIGIHYGFWSRDWNTDFTKYIKKAALLGFDIIEFSSTYMLDMPKNKLNTIKRMAENLNIEITYNTGFPEDKDIASEEDYKRKSGIEYAKRTLEFIYNMGGKILGGTIYSSWPKNFNEVITDKKPYLERSIKSVREIVKTAEEYNILYCLEILNRFEQFLLNTAEEGLGYIEEIGSPVLKLNLDTFHMNIEEDSMSDAIVNTGNKLGHLHIGECNRKIPGMGRMPWDEIIHALKKINYSGRIVMEPFIKMGGEVGRDIKVWRDLSDGANEKKLDIELKKSLKFIRNKINC